MHYYVYIMASKSRVLYIGVTGSLMARILRHKSGEVGSFTRKYRIHRLVYYETFRNIRDAIARETKIKKWRRQKKMALIQTANPTWEDIAADWGKKVPMRIIEKAGSSTPLRCVSE